MKKYVILAFAAAAFSPKAGTAQLIVDGTGKLIVEGSGKVVISGAVTNNGSIEIPTNGTLSLGGIKAGTGTINAMTGSNLEIAATAIAGNMGTLNFAPSGNKLNNLTMNITGTTNPNVSLGNDVTVAGTLLLTSGVLDLGASNLILSGSTSGGSATSFVATSGAGKFTIKNVGPAGKTGDVAFPVGSSVSVYAPVAIENTGTADDFSVISNAALPNGVATAKNVMHSWDISEAVTGGSVAKITATWPQSLEGAGFSREICSVVHYNGTTVDVKGVSGSATTAGTDMWKISGSGFTTFSPFYVTSDATVLPVSILSFTGAKRQNDVLLQWKTGTEINNSYFNIERSKDGGVWSKIGTQVTKATNGNSTTTLNYSFLDTDLSNITGSVYYRLKQVDKDGKETFTQIVVVPFGNSAISNGITAWPNPVSSAMLNVNIFADANKKAIVRLVGITGQIVVERRLDLLAGSNAITIEAIQKMAAGSYRLQVVDATTGKLIGVTQVIKQ